MATKIYWCEGRNGKKWVHMHIKSFSQFYQNYLYVNYISNNYKKYKYPTVIDIEVVENIFCEIDVYRHLPKQATARDGMRGTECLSMLLQM